jgi:hypothetical protein
VAISLPIVSKFDDKGIKQAETQISGFSAIALGAFAKVGAMAVDALAQAGRAAIDYGRDSILMAEGIQTSQARVENINKQMGLFGDQAGKVTKRLTDYANANEKLFAVDEKVIMGTQAKLLTFAELAKTADVAGGAFDRATKAAIDMAAAGFGEAESNAVQLGKALQDPIKGITALTRSGITFNDEQKNLIKTLVESGNILQAQEMILGAIETQVGGTAEATADASVKMKLAFEELQETIGAALLPAFEELVPQIEAFVNELVASPEFNEFLEAMTQNFSNVLTHLPTVLENLNNFGRDVLPVIKEVMPFVNAALEFFVDFLFGIEQSTAADNTRDFADAMRDLAGGFNDVTRFIKDLNTAYNNLPEPIKWVIGQLSRSLNPFVGLNGAPIISFQNIKPVAPIPNTPRGRLVGQANGGVTVKPGLSVIGEDGPEIMAMPRGAGVIPLDRIVGGESKSGGNVFNISVTAGMGTDGAAVGEQIVNAIRRYERTSGAVFARA